MRLLALLLSLILPVSASAQVAPSASQIAAYTGLHLAAHTGDAAAIRRLAADGADLEALRRREDLCWYAHTDALGAPVHCDDLEGQRALERLLGIATQGVRIAVAA